MNKLDNMKVNPAHTSEFPHGIILDDKLTTKIYDTTPSENSYYVSPNFTESEADHRFATIQGAIDQAIADDGSLSDATNQALVMVYPGTYTEQIHSVDGIHIVGVQSQDNRYAKGARLINTGTSEATYPIRANEGDKYRLFGMSIETTSGTGILGKLPQVGIFGSCYFNGQWVENTIDVSNFCIFDDCDLRDANGKAFNLTGSSLAGSRNIALKHSTMAWCAPVFGSTHVGSSIVRFEDQTALTASAFRLSGDWELRAKDSNIANGRDGIEGRSQIGGTGDINIVSCLMNSGLHFTEDPNSTMITNSSFRDGHETIPSGEADITADVDVTNVIYGGNIQFNGICDRVQIVCAEKNVGGGSCDRFLDLQSAITSVPVGGVGVVKIWDDIIDLAEITLPHASTNIQINCLKKYSLTFTADIVEIGADRKLSFINMASLVGGEILLNGANAEIGFEDCQYLKGYLTLQVGAFAIFYKSSAFAPTGHPTINIDNISTILVIGYSRIQGAAGSPGTPGIMFNAVADNKLKTKFSTIIHGDKTTTDPIQSSVGTVVVSVYESAGNANLTPAGITNDISSAGNVYDAQIDF